MLVDAAYLWLEKYAKNEVTLFLVEQKIELKLATVGVVYREDLWEDILECMVVSPMGWQEVQAAWQAAKASLPPLVEDVRAWWFIQVWVSGHMNLQAINAMEVVFGPRFIHAEWMDILSTMIDVWKNNEDGSKICALFKKIVTDHNLSLPPLPSQECHLVIHDLLPLGQDDDHFGWGSDFSKKQNVDRDTCLLHLDLGVIDLMGLEDADETPKAGPSKVSQKQKRDGDGDGDSVEARSLKVSQSQEQRLDTYGEDKEDDEDEEDYSGDNVPTVGHSQLLSSGQASFASQVDNICRCYESGHGGDPSNDTPHPSTFALSIPDATVRVYKTVQLTISEKYSSGNHVSPVSLHRSCESESHQYVEEVASLYSPREVFASAFWVQFKRGIYKNDIGYVLSRDGDRVDILVAPQDCPYDSDLHKLFFDADAARLVEYTVTVEKQALEVVEVPHPNDLAFHSLVGINPSLVSQTIKIFSAQLWQEGDLVHVVEGELRNTPGHIISVDLENKSAAVEIDYRGLINYSCLIFKLQRVYKHGNSVKIFAGPEKGTSGCVLDHRGENLILTVSRHGEMTEVEVDPMLVHSYTPDHMVLEVTQRLDTYSHDPEPPQDSIQIGDCVIVIQGPWRGYIERIVRVALPTLWVDPLAHHKSLKEDMIPWGSSKLSCEDDTIGLSGLLAVSVDDTQIEPPPG
ncbi:hypothetical protein SCLCIDRAFT_20952 [Scleroderma citrinum Foug A]|uniref:Uncharacterized protein n=1 Tax=Scleroderma citrinum Foug A TaxID=1036808 RepID=A0A0C3AR64_9AGAM|nr:hypothetical protein SCLCIDRAFT_20952 [Scleroderma citrinum Foug A]